MQRGPASRRPPNQLRCLATILSRSSNLCKIAPTFSRCDATRPNWLRSIFKREARSAPQTENQGARPVTAAESAVVAIATRARQMATVGASDCDRCDAGSYSCWIGSLSGLATTMTLPSKKFAARDTHRSRAEINAVQTRSHKLACDYPMLPISAS